MDDSVLYWLRESASGSGFALGPGLQWNDPTTRMVQCTMCLARLNGTIYNARPAQPWVDPHTSARGFTPKTLSTRCNHYIGEVISWSRPRGGRSEATGNAPITVLNPKLMLDRQAGGGVRPSRWLVAHLSRSTMATSLQRLQAPVCICPADCAG